MKKAKTATIIHIMKKLSREFYIRDALLVAHDLVGKILVHHSPQGITSGIIIETEAYKGPEDKAAHSYTNRRTSRTEIMFHCGGHAYIFMIYGLYPCFNVTANYPDFPEAVLIRALEPLDGLDLMRSRRPKASRHNLTSGPGKLCKAMGIDMSLYAEDLCGDRLYILDNDTEGIKVSTSPRFNIAYAEEFKEQYWRFFIDGNNYLSKA